MMHKVDNYMIQAQYADGVVGTIKSWQDHFKAVCEEHGLKVTPFLGQLRIENPTGEPFDVQPLCKEASRRSFGRPRLLGDESQNPWYYAEIRQPSICGTIPGCIHYPPETLTREEYDKEVDRKEDLRDLDASKRAHREHLKTMAEEALRLAKAERHVPFMLAWASVIVSIEKDLI